MSINKVDEIPMSQSLVTYLTYGDRSSINETEEQQVDNFFGRYSFVEIDEEPVSFERCRVTGYLADCVKINCYIVE